MLRLLIGSKARHFQHFDPEIPGLLLNQCLPWCCRIRRQELSALSSDSSVDPILDASWRKDAFAAISKNGTNSEDFLFTAF